MKIELFEKKIDRTGSCWNWTAGTSNDGYGRFSVGGYPEYAHRVAYALWVGEIPSDMVVHHKCKNKLCVNPEHLEAVSVETSVNRSDRAKPLNRTHCIRGHELVGENKYAHRRKGHRPSYECLACRRENDRRSYAKRTTRL